MELNTATGGLAISGNDKDVDELLPSVVDILESKLPHSIARVRKLTVRHDLKVLATQPPHYPGPFSVEERSTATRNKPSIALFERLSPRHTLRPLLVGSTRTARMGSNTAVYYAMYLTTTRPFFQQVDMRSPCAMRRFLAPYALAAIEKEAGVRRDLISLIPWWQKTIVLVVVPGGGNDPDVMAKVVSGVVRWLSFHSVLAAHSLDGSQATLMLSFSGIEFLTRKLPRCAAVPER